MKSCYIAELCLLIIFMMLAGSISWAETSLNDPEIPNGEN